MKDVCILTLGCKVNQYDSDAMLKVFLDAGYAIYDTLEKADIYIVNTCAVTKEAEKKSRQMITKILKKNPQGQIYVCGCASQHDAIQFLRENVIYVQGNKNKVELAKQIVSQEIKFSNRVSDDFSLAEKCNDCGDIASFKTRYFIKIQDGCNARCSYCIIPFLRGKSRSRDVDEILKEIDSLEDKKEIVLIGINLSAYGKDINTNLTKLMKALSKYDFRVRLGSLEPNVITQEFLTACKGIKNFCPHFHLSLQSANDAVLADMRRAYRMEAFEKAVDLIRANFDNPALTGDVIVGYPTETREQFLDSKNKIEKMRFTDIHIFPYSAREGTKAAEYIQINKEEVRNREEELTKLKEELRLKYLGNQLNKTHEVLFENQQNGYSVGHTKNYIKVYCKGKYNNEIRQIKAKGLYLDGILAEINS